MKPDLTLNIDGRLIVADVTVATDQYMDKAHEAKILKYGAAGAGGAIKVYAASLGLAHTSADLVPLVFSQRGHIMRATAQHLRKWGLSTFDVAQLCLSSITGSLRTYAAYCCSTFRL